ECFKISISPDCRVAIRLGVSLGGLQEDDESSDVVIDRKKFGDIKQNAITEYRKSKFAHRYASASLLANSKPLGTQPVVYGAETELGSGRFTIRAYDSRWPFGPLCRKGQRLKGL